MAVGWPEIEDWCIVYGVEAFVTVVVNGITIAVIINSSFLHKRFYYLLLSLAVADFLVGAINAPMYIYVLGGYYQKYKISDPKHLYPAQTMVDIFTSYASIYALTVIAIERLISVLDPYAHRKESRISYISAIIITWLLALMTCLFYLVRLHNKDDWFGLFIFIMVLLSLCLLITLVSYAIIATTLCLSSNSTITTLQQKERRLAVTLLLASIIFIVTWLPFQVENYLYHFNPKIQRSHHHIYAAKFLHFLNSTVNPFIYALLLKDFRKGLQQLFCCHASNELEAPNGHVEPVRGAKGNEGYYSNNGAVYLTMVYASNP